MIDEQEYDLLSELRSLHHLVQTFVSGQFQLLFHNPTYALLCHSREEELRSATRRQEMSPLESEGWVNYWVEKSRGPPLRLREEPAGRKR